MSSSKVHAERLARAITLSGLAEPVQSNGPSDDRISVLCRVPPGQEAGWTELLRKLLLLTETQQRQPYAWQAHICRHYFLKEVNGEKKMVFGWNISLQSTDLQTATEYIVRVIKGDQLPESSTAEVEEMPMTGVAHMRNIPKHRGGKGVHTIGGDSDFKVK